MPEPTKKPAASDLSAAPCSICTWCDEPIEADHPSVPDVGGDAGDMQHIGCAVEEADNIGFDGFMQDQG